MSPDQMHPQCCQNHCEKFVEDIDDGKTAYGSMYCKHFFPAKKMNGNEVEHIYFRGCCAYEKGE